MNRNIIVEEDSIEMVVEVTKTVFEFDDKIYDREYFEKRIIGKDNLILVAYIENEPVGYIVSYDKYQDGSFFCFMAGVNPKFRRLGVLTKLMEYLINNARTNDYKKIKIKTRNTRREMLSYLVKNGFSIVKIYDYPHIINNRIMFEKEI